MDGGRTVVGAVCVQHAGDKAGCHQSTGGAGLEASDEAGEGDGHLPGPRRALPSDIRRSDQTGHDQLCGARVAAAPGARRDQDEDSSVSDTLRELVRDNHRRTDPLPPDPFPSPLSSIAFGMRKALLSEQRKMEMEENVNRLVTENSDLERQVQELKELCEATERKELERRTLDEKKHADEVQSLTKSNAEFKKKLEDLLAPSQPATHKK
mmetsp:Transcript_32894/g.104021  ORF Transcript_32894/g.104021 Transcript_32894/m.104021 type:complete len:210 (+) Transcript_32894:200-829(+)